MSSAEQVEKIKKYAEIFLEVISDNNKHIIGSDFKFINRIESVTTLLKNIVDYKLIKSDREIMEDFKVINNQIQMDFKRIQEYQETLR